MSKLLSAHIPRVSCLALALCCVLAGGLLFGGLASAALAASATAPASTEAPVLSGTPAVGQTLSCSQGAWANDPSVYTYAWLRDGSPIAGQTESTYVVQSTDQGHTISCQVTAANGGEYTIVGLAPGAYEVRFSGEGYVPGSSTGVSVAAGSATAGVDASLSVAPAVPADGAISGRVRSNGGVPLAGILVSAVQAGGGLEAGATTNADGEYTISGLPVGSYVVEFSRNEGGGNYLAQYYGGKASRSEAQTVSVAAGGTTSGIDAEMQPGGQIAGTVSAASGGGPIAGVRVCARGEQESCVSTGAGGEYTIVGLSTGAYVVEFSRYEEGYVSQHQFYDGKASWSEAERVSVAAGSTTGGIDASLPALSPGGRITGMVTSAVGGAPLAGVEVCIEQIAPYLGCETTNAAGEYTLSHLPYGSGGLGTGSYEVVFVRGSAGNYLTQGVSVAVTAGSTTAGVNVEMQPGGQVTGRVTSAAGGAPLVGVEACVTFTVESIDCGATNANGEYTISGLPTGSYEVEFFKRSSGGGYYLPLYVGGVSVIAGSTTSGVDVETRLGGQITGIVTSATDGVSLAGIEVCVQQRGERVPREGGGEQGCATTNAGGSASATSNALAVPVASSTGSAPGGALTPDSEFSLIRAPVFDAKTGDLDFYVEVVNAGMLRSELSFEGSSVVGVVRGARASRRGRLAGRHLRVPFGSASKRVPAGVVEVEVHAGAKALRALKAGRMLHVSGPFAFQSVLGGAPVVHMESVVVRWPKKKKHGGVSVIGAGRPEMARRS